MMKLLVNQAIYQQGLHATQVIGTLLDGAAATPRRAMRFRRSPRKGLPRGRPTRDEPFGDLGAHYKG